MLSEEEKKAIKVLEQYKKECIEEYKIEIDNVEENIDQQHASYLHQQIEATYRVLNLITKLQKEIDHQKEKRENQKTELAILNEKQKEMNKLINDVKSYKGQFERQEKQIRELQKENEKKDKQIDLIINFIYEVLCKYPGTISHALRRNGFNDDECGTCENTDKNCVKCLKQYFEKLAKEKGE